jgi:hypothetical protein
VYKSLAYGLRYLIDYKNLRVLESPSLEGLSLFCGREPLREKSPTLHAKTAERIPRRTAGIAARITPRVPRMRENVPLSS